MDVLSRIGVSNKVQVEYRWSVLQHALHQHAGRQWEKVGNEILAEMHHRISRKHHSRFLAIEKLQPTLQRAVHESVLRLSRKVPEWEDYTKLPPIYIPYADGKKLCNTCGRLHDRDNMGATCTHIGNSHQDRYAYYNCQCGSTLTQKRA